MKKYLFLILILFFNQIYAVSCNTSSGGALDNLLIQFANSASNWQYTIEPLAKKIFYILFVTEFMWQLTVKKVFAGDIEKLWVFFFTRISLCFFFAKYIVNIKLYKQAIEYIMVLGGRASGFNMGSNVGGLMSLGPSEVVSNFACISDVVHQVTDTTGAFDYLTLKFTLAILQVLLLIILVYIAFQLIKVILQTYFLLYVGFLLTGFSGSSWTYTFWERYVRTVVGIAIKFLAFCFILGVLMNQMHSWANDMNTATSNIELGGIVLKVFASSLIYALLIAELPEWASSNLTGSVNINRGSTMIAQTMSGTNNINQRIQVK